MNRFLVIACVILSLSSCLKGGRPERRFFQRTLQSKITKYKACKKVQVIAVIDTGFGADDSWTGQETAHLCKFGHKNFVPFADDSDRFGTKDPVPVDVHGHGTHIAGLIDYYASKTNNSFCLVILKYYDENAPGLENLQHTVEAIDYARKIKASFINYSGGGILRAPEEEKAVKDYIDAGGTFVAAAGNEGSDIDFWPYYPAQEDDRVIAVGNGENQSKRAPSSNYGDRVNRWEIGKNVLMYNHYMSGTSQSTAIATGKIVAEKNKTCK